MGRGVLLLFDVDGTLVRTAGAGRHALNAAFQQLYGFEGALDGVRLDGNTDPQILEQVFRTRWGRSARPEEEAALRACYLEHLPAQLEARRAEYQVLPGVRSCLEWAAGRFAVGLATGNIEAGARMKLEPGDLGRYFRFGGFGSDGAERAELVRQAIRRGEAHAGRRFAPREVVVIGDTERDVHAARAVGCRAVGVLAGCSDVDRLEASRPDWLAPDFDDPQLRRWIESAP
jgi:phosphoglycolate phosphatase-like HAD superfamily hydrolase